MNDRARSAAAAWRRDPTPSTEATLVEVIRLSPRRWLLPDDSTATSQQVALDAWRVAELRGGSSKSGRPKGSGDKAPRARRGDAPVEPARHAITPRLTDDAKAVYDAYEPRGPEDSKSQWLSRIIVKDGGRG